MNSFPMISACFERQWAGLSQYEREWIETQTACDPGYMPMSYPGGLPQPRPYRIHLGLQTIQPSEDAEVDADEGGGVQPCGEQMPNTDRPVDGHAGLPMI